MSKVRNTATTIDIATILKAAQHEMERAASWRGHPSIAGATRTAEALISAVALIELVETHYCGSVGGFGPGQTNAQRHTIGARLHYLEGVYGLH